MKSKKLLIIGPFAPTGGIGTLLNSTIKILKRDENIDLQTFNISNLRKSIGYLKGLCKKILNAEIVHIHCAFFTFVPSLQLLVPSIISKILGKKIVVTHHTGETIKYFENNQKYLQLLFSSADIITVPSRYQKELFLEYDIVSSENIKILRNFVNPYYLSYSEDIAEDKEDCVITTGEVNEENISRKGFDDFIRIARDMPNVKFLLVGKISDEGGEKLRDRSPPNVMIPGFVSEKQLAKFYSKSKIYLQLSRSESFGISVIEAMVFNTTPIVYDRSALPEVVGDEGYTVDYKDTERVKELIAKIMDGKGSKNPRKRVISNFTQREYIKEYLEIISSL